MSGLTDLEKRGLRVVLAKARHLCRAAMQLETARKTGPYTTAAGIAEEARILGLWEDSVILRAKVLGGAMADLEGLLPTLDWEEIEAEQVEALADEH